MSTKHKNGSPTRASQIMDQFQPEHKTQLQATVDEVTGIREAAHQLIGSVAQYADILQTDKVKNHPEIDTIVRFARGIVDDSKMLQAKLQKVDEEHAQLLALAKTAHDDSGVLLPKSIQVSQDYHDIIAQWDYTVKPTIDELTKLLLEGEEQ